MLQTPRSTRGMVVAPHHLASQAGLRVLQDGGNAIEAMIAAAATIAVVYPHMNGLGGDNFWLIHTPNAQQPTAIDACGAVATKADLAFYRDHDCTAIPSRGPLAANTVAGAVSGWQQALNVSKTLGGKLPLSRLLEDAIWYAQQGMPVSASQHHNTVSKLAELGDVPGFADRYLDNGQPPTIGALFKNTKLADTLERLSRAGFEDFYQGELAQAISADLERVGSPINAADLAQHQAQSVTPLQVELNAGSVYNLPPPTQGLASLILLAVFERLNCQQAENFDFLHGLVEATKCAFRVRDQHITDPAYMSVEPASFLAASMLDEMVASIDTKQAAPWGQNVTSGDTVWLGAIDNQGRAVSFIQSIYWEFGSGVVLPSTGITWQNRGSSFSLDANALNTLKPGRKPFHTIQPALARLKDGRVMIYGTMGGEGQPQTQAAIFTRHVLYGQDLQTAITAPRWLLGRTWGSEQTNLRIENRFDPTVIETMRQACHDVEVVSPFEEFMGHAGALVCHPSGLIEGAVDPRSDGVVAAY